MAIEALCSIKGTERNSEKVGEKIAANMRIKRTAFLVSNRIECEM